MRLLPARCKPYLGFALIAVAGIAFALAFHGGPGRRPDFFVTAGLGTFLLLGIALVLEPFLGKGCLLGLLLLFGTAFFSAMVLVVTLGLGIPLPRYLVVPLGAVAALGYYRWQKRTPHDPTSPPGGHDGNEEGRPRDEAGQR